MIKFTTATEAIPYIGQPCLIFDSLENKSPVEAYIEGVDIVANKIIAERANFEPHQIAIPIENYEHNLVGLAFYDLKGDIEKYIGEGYKREAKENKSNDRLAQIADEYIKGFIESDYVEMRIVDNKVEVVGKSSNKEIEINISLDERQIQSSVKAFI
jgi:hypothetical protein